MTNLYTLVYEDRNQRKNRALANHGAQRFVTGKESFLSE